MSWLVAAACSQQAAEPEPSLETALIEVRPVPPDPKPVEAPPPPPVVETPPPPVETPPKKTHHATPAVKKPPTPHETKPAEPDSPLETNPYLYK